MLPTCVSLLMNGGDHCFNDFCAPTVPARPRPRDFLGSTGFVVDVVRAFGLRLAY